LEIGGPRVQSGTVTGSVLTATALLGDKPVHRIGFGAMQLAGPDVFGPPSDPEAAAAVLRRAVERGVDHIDTAQFYGPDVVNELISSTLHPYPDGLRLVTKVGAVRDEVGAWLPSGEPADLKRQVEQNLRSLRVERMDLVNLRRFERDAPDMPQPPLADQLGALAELRDEGKLDLIGLSNVGEDSVRAGIDQGGRGIACVQNAYSVLDRTDEAIVQLCRDHDVAFVPYFPLGSAWGGRERLAASTDIAAVADKHGATVTQIALAWLLARYDRMLLIPGTSSLDHLEENLAVERITLDADDLTVLDAIG